MATMTNCPCCGNAPADGQGITVAAFIVSDAGGNYVARYTDEDEADDHAAEAEGQAVGVEYSDGCVTFER